MEEWRLITDYPSYMVSDMGNVKNTATDTIKKATQRPDGYKVVGLWDKGVSEVCYIHRLVGEAFLPNPDNKHTINHKDGDKGNNHLSNLEWATNSENNQHAYDNLPRKKCIQPSSVRIRQLNLDGTLYHEWGSMRECAIGTGFPMSSLRQALTPTKGIRTHAGLKRGQRKAKGFLWEKV